MIISQTTFVFFGHAWRNSTCLFEYNFMPLRSRSCPDVPVLTAEFVTFNHHTFRSSDMTAVNFTAPLQSRCANTSTIYSASLNAFACRVSS